MGAAIGLVVVLFDAIAKFEILELLEKGEAAAPADSRLRQISRAGRVGGCGRALYFGGQLLHRSSGMLHCAFGGFTNTVRITDLLMRLLSTLGNILNGAV